VTLALVGLVAALQATSPSFEFRKFTSAYTRGEAEAAGAVLTLGRTVYCDDVPMNGRTVSVCSLSQSFIEGGIAGRAMRAGQAGFDSEGTALFRLHFAGEDASAVVVAMTAKFGDPCRTEVAEWRNRMGAVLDNPITTWCLSDGELAVIGRAAQDPNLAEVRFVAARLNEQPAATVDF
jgi:hypothetical protein